MSVHMWERRTTPVPAPVPVWRAVATTRLEQYSSMANEAAIIGGIDGKPDPVLAAWLQGGADAIRAILAVDRPSDVMAARIKGAADALRAMVLDIETAEGGR